MFLIYLLNRYVDFVLSPLKYQVWQTRFLGCGSCYIKIYIFLIPFQNNPSIPPYLSLNVNFSSTCLDFSCLLKWLHWPYQYNFLYQRFYIITCCLQIVAEVSRNPTNELKAMCLILLSFIR